MSWSDPVSTARQRPSDLLRRMAAGTDEDEDPFDDLVPVAVVVRAANGTLLAHLANTVRKLLRRSGGPTLKPVEEGNAVTQPGDSLP